MKKIQLGHHRNETHKNPIMYALVDDDVYEELSQYKWYAMRSKYTFYAMRKIRNRKGATQSNLQMHRAILHAQPNQIVDHKNGNGLDNRKVNIRICTNSENCRNKNTQKNNTSGYKGVSFHKQAGKWLARITTPEKRISLGLFKTKEDAHKIYFEASQRLHGEFSVFSRNV